MANFSEQFMTFFKVGGHNHDGENSSPIDISKYSANELADIQTKIIQNINLPVSRDFPTGVVIGQTYVFDAVAAPTNLALTTGENFVNYEQVWINATWDAPVGEDGTEDIDNNGFDDTNPPLYADQAIEYEITLYPTGNPSDEKVQRTKNTYVSFQPVEPTTNYTVEVRSVNLLGVKSSAITDTITSSVDTVAPAQTTGVVANSGYRTTTITWTPAAEADVINSRGYYDVQIDTVNTFNSGNLRSQEVTATICSFADLNTGTEYFIRVRAVDSSGNQGAWSATVSTTPGTIAGTDLGDGSAPASSPTPDVQPHFRSFFVTWDNVTNNDPVTYEVHVSATSGFTPGAGTKVGEVQGTLMHVDTLANGSNFAYGTTYYFKTIAKDADGAAAASAQASGQVDQITSGDTDDSIAGSDGNPPASSPTPTITGGPNYLLAEWSPVANLDIVTYEVHISTSSGFTPSGSTLVGETAGTFYFITVDGASSPLAYGTTYYVKLIAKDDDGSAAASAQDSGAMVKIQTVDVEDNAVTTNKIVNDAITAAKIGTDAVTTTKIINDAITNAKMAADSVSPDNISDGVFGDSLTINPKMNSGIEGYSFNTPSYWSAAYVTDDSPYAGSSETDVIRMVTTAGQTGHHVYSSKIPIDTSKTYLITWWVRKTSGATNNRYYFGVHVSPNSTNGGHGHYIKSLYDIPSTWTKVQGTVGPKSISGITSANWQISPSFNPEAQYFSPEIIGPYNATEAITIEIAEITVVEVVGDEYIASNAILESKLADNAVTLNKLAANSVNTSKIVDDAITNVKIATDAVAASQIQTGAVLEAKLADNAVSLDKLAANSVDTSKILDDAITNLKIADNAVLEAKLADNAVTLNKLAANSVNTSKLVDAAITEVKIATDAITNAKLADNAVQAENIVTDAITNAKIANNAVDTAELVNSAITEAKIATNAVTNTKIADSAVSTDKIVNAAITNAKIGTDAVDTANIVDAAIEAAKLNITVGGMNLLTNSSFEDDSVDAWIGYSSGSASVARTFDATEGWDGSQSQKAEQNGTGVGNFGLRKTDLPLSLAVGDTYTLSCYAKGNAGAQDDSFRLYIREYGGVSQPSTTADFTLTSEWQRFSVSRTITESDNVGLDLRFFIINGEIGDIFWIDAVQFELGDVLTGYAPRPDEILSGAITETHIADDSISTPKLQANVVTAAKIAANTITAAEIASNTITATEIAADAITTDELLAGAVTTAKIAAGAVTANEIAANTITANEIASGAITTDELAANSVTANKLLVTVGGENLAPNSTFTDGHTHWAKYNNSPGTEPDSLSHVSSGGVDGGAHSRLTWSNANTTTKGIQYTGGSANRPDWVPNETYVVSWWAKTSGSGATGMSLKWGSGPATQTALQNPTPSSTWQRYVYRITWGATVQNSARIYISIDGPGTTDIEIDHVQVEKGDTPTDWKPRASELLPGTIVTDMLAADAVTAAKIAAGTITANEIASNTILAGNIASGTITANEIAASTITGAKIAAGTITAGNIASNTITATEIAASTITGANIASDTITAGNIAANAITTSELNAEAVTTAKIAAGAVTANEIAANTITSNEVAARSILAESLSVVSIDREKSDALKAAGILSPRIACHPTATTVRYVALEDNTYIYKDGVQVAGPISSGTTGTISSVSPGQIVHASKPTELTYDVLGVSLPPITWATPKLIAQQGRYVTTYAVVAPYGDVSVEVRETDPDKVTPDATLNISSGSQATYTSSSSAAMDIYFVATGPIVITQDGTGGDDAMVSPPARSVLHGTTTPRRASFGAYGGMTTVDADDSVGTKIGELIYADDLLMAANWGDGDGAALEYGMGLEYLGDTYIGFIEDSCRVLTVVPNIITIDHWNGSAWVNSDSVDMSDATESAPRGEILTLGAQDAVHRIRGTAPFLCRADNNVSDEYALIGYRSSVRTQFENLDGRVSNWTAVDGVLIDGGQIYADSVTATQIAANTITASEIAADTITAAEVASGTITSNEIAAGTITASNIAAGTITTTQIAAGTITASNIASNTITAAEIAADAVNTSELAANAVTAAKIAAGTITANEIASNTITAGNIAASTITGAKIAADTITASNIATDAITADEILAGSVTTAKIATGAVTANEIAANTITASEIASATITSSEIATNTITANNIAASTITGAKIAAGTITASNIATDTITANEIAANAITASEINTDAVTSAKIQAGAVTTDKMTANTINGDRIQAGTLNASKITAGSITTDRMTSNTINGDRITANTLNASKIVAGSITTDRMTAGTINADRLTSGSVTATQIAASTITANEIASNAITTAKLNADAVTAAKLSAMNIEAGKYIRSTTYVSGTSGWSIDANGSAEFNDVLVRGRISSSSFDGFKGTNLLANGTFDTNASNWTTNGNSTLTRKTDTPQAGAGYGSLQNTSGSTNTTSMTSDMMTGVVGDFWYEVTGYLSIGSSNTNTTVLDIKIEWYTSGDSLIQTDTAVNDFLVSFTDWRTQVPVNSVKSPVNAAKAKIVFEVPGTANNDEFHVDSLSFNSTPVYEGISRGAIVFEDPNGTNPSHSVIDFNAEEGTTWRHYTNLSTEVSSGAIEFGAWPTPTADRVDWLRIGTAAQNVANYAAGIELYSNQPDGSGLSEVLFVSDKTTFGQNSAGDVLIYGDTTLTNDVTIGGSVVLTNDTDISSLNQSSMALQIGSGSGDHVMIDGNEMQCVTSANAARDWNINLLGGGVRLGSEALVDEWDSGSGYAVFGHASHGATSATEYGFMQHSGGDIFMSAAGVFQRRNNSASAQQRLVSFSGTLWEVDTDHASFVGITTSTNTGSTARFITGSITDQLYRYTSSIKFKEDVKDTDFDTSSIFDLRVRDWKSNITWDDKVGGLDDPSKRIMGLVAEEVASISPDFVTSNILTGEVNGIDETKIMFAMLVEMQKLRNEVNELKGESPHKKSKVKRTSKIPLSEAVEYMLALEEFKTEDQKKFEEDLKVLYEEMAAPPEEQPPVPEELKFANRDPNWKNKG